MPCNSDYMEQTVGEKYKQKTAQILQWVSVKVFGSASHAIRQDAQDYYCKNDRTAELCEILRGMDSEDRDRLIYGDARDSDARQLATWWEEHQENDRKREAAEAKFLQNAADKAIKEKARKKAVKSAKLKLTQSELDALGIK